jgi:hypothetical protein
VRFAREAALLRQQRAAPRAADLPPRRAALARSPAAAAPARCATAAAALDQVLARIDAGADAVQ